MCDSSSPKTNFLKCDNTATPRILSTLYLYIINRAMHFKSFEYFWRVTLIKKTWLKAENFHECIPESARSFLFLFKYHKPYVVSIFNFSCNKTFWLWNEHIWEKKRKEMYMIGRKKKLLFLFLTSVTSMELLSHHSTLVSKLNW